MSLFSFFQGKKGVVKHMFKGVLFIHDVNETENGGFFCAKAEHCVNTKNSAEVLLPPPPMQSFSENFVCGLDFVLLDGFSYCIIIIVICFFTTRMTVQAHHFLRPLLACSNHLASKITHVAVCTSFSLLIVSLRLEEVAI